MVTRLALVLAVLAGCASAELDPPIVRTVTGPAAGRVVRRVVALRPTCGTLAVRAVRGADGELTAVDAECTDALLDGIAQYVRGELDFRGYHVIDAERVNAVTASRHDEIRRDEVSSPGFHATTGIERSQQTAVTFEDATPREQLALLHALGADALLTTRVWVGAGVGLSSRHDVIVQVRLTAAADHRMIWARRCELEIGGLVTDNVAIDRAAHCAAQELPAP